MTSSRLWNYPSETLEVLQSIISGNNTKEEIADRIGCAESTVHNKLHDPLHLGLIQNEGGEYKAIEEVRRLIQLQDNQVLEKRFLQLDGVEDILNELESEGQLSFERIGRIVSFKTESGASKEETFSHYGRIYAGWFDYLDLGYSHSSSLYNEKPDSYEREEKSNLIRAPPKLVFQMLKTIEECETRKDIEEKLDISDSSADRGLSTLYTLGLAKQDRSEGFKQTELGTKIISSSIGQRKRLLLDPFKEVAMMKAYFKIAPETDYSHIDIIRQVSEEYLLGWSEGTIDFRARQTYPWLIFLDLAEELDGFRLRPKEKMNQLDVSPPTDL